MTRDAEHHQPEAGRDRHDQQPPTPHGAHGADDAHTGHDATAGSDHEGGGHQAPAGHGTHDSHVEHAAAPPRLPERVQKLMRHLQEMRVLQAVLGREYDREMAEQRQHDAHVRRLMETDPTGHIETMRPMQEHKALVRELPEALLRHEAELYQEIERLRPPPAVTELEHGPVMAWHVLAEHWVHIAVMPLGAWLLFSPSALAYPSAATAWNDMISGVLVILFAVLSMKGFPWAPWANAAVGLWVAFAPLAFWAPDPASYANDTLVGILIAAFSVIIPMRSEMPGPEVPPGWTYNPSTWAQRAPVIALATVSFFLARYMASFQLGHTPQAWDPIFGAGTELVLTSAVSRAFLVSDAGLGAYSYLLELLSAVMGDGRRWRTMPWMVAMFGVLVIPLGVTSVVLIMLQPVAVGAWCTICLITALFMLIMVAVSLDEVVAMIQFLVVGKRSGASAWRLFWMGGSLPKPVEDIGLSRRPAASGAVGFSTEMFRGASVSWPLLGSALVGAWVMAGPWVFGTTGPAFRFESIFGALAVVTTFVAWAEVTRLFRGVNVLIGLAIAIAAWLFPDMSLAARLGDLVAGLLLVVLSVPRGRIRDRYGSWDPLIV
ncbi:MAG TPA: vitamin K epoxide reductase family protein [Methylomirabilota bacterium]|nr:vitamin K epoxide reductase family protein [Methylomirabilota bacterium]